MKMSNSPSNGLPSHGRGAWGGGSFRTGRPDLLLRALVSLTLAFGGALTVLTLEAPKATAAGALEQLVFEERFESVNVAASTSSLVSSTSPYVGSNGEIYVADPYWQTEEVCNGIILQYNTGIFGPTMCQNSTTTLPGEQGYAISNAQPSLRAMAYALGRYDAGTYTPWNVGDPLDATATGNAAVAEYTQFSIPQYPSAANPINGAAGLRIIEMTTDPIPVASAQNGYYRIGIDVAELNCGIGYSTFPNSTNSSLTFW